MAGITTARPNRLQAKVMKDLAQGKKPGVIIKAHGVTYAVVRQIRDDDSLWETSELTRPERNIKVRGPAVPEPKLSKAQFLKLQKVHITDKAIGEALGGVPSGVVCKLRNRLGIPVLHVDRSAIQLQIVKAFAKGAKRKDLAAKFGVPIIFVYATIQNHEIWNKLGMTRPGPSNEVKQADAAIRRSITKPQLLRLIKKYHTDKAVSEALGLQNAFSVTEKRKVFGIEFAGKAGSPRNQQIYADFLAGMNNKELVKKHKLCRSTLCRIIQKQKNIEGKKR